MQMMESLQQAVQARLQPYQLDVPIASPFARAEGFDTPGAAGRIPQNHGGIHIFIVLYVCFLPDIRPWIQKNCNEEEFVSMNCNSWNKHFPKGQARGTANSLFHRTH